MVKPQQLQHAVRQAINLAKFDPNTLDITTYLNVAHRILKHSQKGGQKEIAFALLNLGTVVEQVIHNVCETTTTWDEFHIIVIQTAQPSLLTVVALIYLQNMMYKDNLDTNEEELQKCATQAYPGATRAELQQHTIAILQRTLPRSDADYFTL